MNMPPKRLVLLSLIGIDLVLLLLHIVSSMIVEERSWTIANWFNLDAESNIPTWFSSTQLSLTSLLAFANFAGTDQSALRRAFLIAALGFLFLSMDEAASIHEGVTQIFRSLGIDSSRPYVPGVWTIVYPIVGLVIAGTFFREAKAFLADAVGRSAFFCGAVLFVSGSLLLEVASYFIVPSAGADSIYAFIAVCVEESFEMLGVSLMAYAMLAKLDARTAHQATPQSAQR